MWSSLVRPQKACPVFLSLLCGIQNYKAVEKMKSFYFDFLPHYGHKPQTMESFGHKLKKKKKVS